MTDGDLPARASSDPIVSDQMLYVFDETDDSRFGLMGSEAIMV
jgi:hypothetical protein